MYYKFNNSFFFSLNSSWVKTPSSNNFLYLIKRSTSIVSFFEDSFSVGVWIENESSIEELLVLINLLMVSYTSCWLSKKDNPITPLDDVTLTVFNDLLSTEDIESMGIHLILLLCYES